MAFSSKQTRLLKTRLKEPQIRTREVEGKTLSYIEGWYAVAEANRIFGFEGWDRETLSSQCIWQKVSEGRAGVAYLTRVRITVRAGEHVILREGLGSSEAYAPTLGQAHERAAKAAETDATKRALSTFGNCFGLSLYAEKQPRDPLPYRPLVCVDPPGANPKRTASSPLDNELPATNSAADVETPGRAPVRGPAPPAFRVSPPLNAGTSGRFLDTVRHVEAANDSGRGGQPMLLPVTAHTLPTERRPVDKSELPIGEPKRLRSVEHLRFVGQQACLVCGRQPSQAHHLRFAQPRALSRKVSDEFAVPLCSFHHDEVHKTGNEFQWWRARGIDAMKEARSLWTETRNFPGSRLPLVEVEPGPPTQVQSGLGTSRHTHSHSGEVTPPPRPPSPP